MWVAPGDKRHLWLTNHWSCICTFHSCPSICVTSGTSPKIPASNSMWQYMTYHRDEVHVLKATTWIIVWDSSNYLTQCINWFVYWLIMELVAGVRITVERTIQVQCKFIDTWYEHEVVGVIVVSFLYKKATLLEIGAHLSIIHHRSCIGFFPGLLLVQV